MLDFLGSVLTSKLNDPDRFKMLQEQQALTQRDLEGVTKRYHDLKERFTDMGLEYNRVTGDLSAAHGQIDQLHHECENLRAEKKIWGVSFFIT